MLDVYCFMLGVGGWIKLILINGPDVHMNHHKMMCHEVKLSLNFYHNSYVNGMSIVIHEIIIRSTRTMQYTADLQKICAGQNNFTDYYCMLI